MRTTVDLPDDLFRQIKSRAAIQGRPLKDLIAEGLRLVLKAPAHASSRPRRKTFPIIKTKDPNLKLTEATIALAEEKLLNEEAVRYARPPGH